MLPVYGWLVHTAMPTPEQIESNRRRCREYYRRVVSDPGKLARLRERRTRNQRARRDRIRAQRAAADASGEAVIRKFVNRWTSR